MVAVAAAAGAAFAAEDKTTEVEVTQEKEEEEKKAAAEMELQEEAVNAYSIHLLTVTQHGKHKRKPRTQKPKRPRSTMAVP